MKGIMGAIPDAFRLFVRSAHEHGIAEGKDGSSFSGKISIGPYTVAIFSQDE